MSKAAARTDIGRPKPAGPFSPFERMMAMRYLRARRKEAFVSVIAIFSFIGILLGVATLIIVMAVMNGFRQELTSRILGINGHMVVQPIDMPMTEYDALAARLSAVPGVKLAVPMVEGQTLSSGNSGPGTGALVRGVREADLKRFGMVANNIRQGSLDGFDAAEGVAIGIRMSENLGLSLGDQLTLVSPEGDVTPFGTTPRVVAYPVVAIFEIGMSEYDSSIVFLPLTAAQVYFNSEEQVQSIDVFLDNADEVDAARPLLTDAAQRPVFITDWRQRNRSFFAALEIDRNVQFIVLSLIILVAALNIISGLIMLVKDKGRDIAIMRTMGATSGAILRIFVMTGSTIGVLGTLVGLALGVLFVRNIKTVQSVIETLSGGQVWDPTIRYLSEIPARMDIGETASIVAMGLVLSFLATLYPAWRAARLDPVEALRYE
ncbi:MAG: lipoprotein-releasing ABC transporter permease subunit [Rhizobiaceae bacterium]|nr:lipoprotein-releasing ABC transporter permease subunit [Rhizobiaceae bacterium]